MRKNEEEVRKQAREKIEKTVKSLVDLAIEVAHQRRMGRMTTSKPGNYQVRPLKEVRDIGKTHNAFGRLDTTPLREAIPYFWHWACQQDHSYHLKGDKFNDPTQGYLFPLDHIAHSSAEIHDIATEIMRRLPFVVSHERERRRMHYALLFTPKEKSRGRAGTRLVYGYPIPMESKMYCYYVAKKGVFPLEKEINPDLEPSTSSLALPLPRDEGLS